MENLIIKTLEFLKGQSIQVAIVFVAVLILTWLLQNKSAHVRYLLWLLVAIKCLTPPLVIFSVPVLPAETISVATPAQPVEIDYQPIQNTAIAIQPDNTRSQAPIENSSPKDQPSKIYPQGTNNPLTDFFHLNSTGVILFLWAAGAACYLLLALGKAVRLGMQLRSIRKPLPAQLMIDQIEMLTKLWNYPGGFKVWLVDGINQPFVWGLWRGAIYLPTRFQSIQGDKQKAIVLHEMAHVVRFDAFVNLIQILIQGVFWFHPLVWLANKAIRQEREKCCDEIAVARLGTAPKEYGSAIVDTLLQEAQAGLVIPTLAVAGPVKNIEDRIKTIMQPGRRFFHRPSTIALLIVGMLAMIIIPTTIALTQKVTPPDYTLSGTVLDAATEKPIAGAIVFDDGYGPQPYQKGITDDAGKFEYKSWNEEHNIAAKADGYQTQTMTFTTFPLDNSKKLNFKLQIDRPMIKRVTIPVMEVWLTSIDGDDIEVFDLVSCKFIQYKNIKNEYELLQQKQGDIICHYHKEQQKLMITFLRSARLDGTEDNDKPLSVTVMPIKMPYEAKVTTTEGCKYNVKFISSDEKECVMEYWPLNKEAEKAMAEAKEREIAKNPFTATLPNGVSVELVGICKDPSQDNQEWWSADGMPCIKPLLFVKPDKILKKPFFGYFVKITPSNEISFDSSNSTACPQSITPMPGGERVIACEWEKSSEQKPDYADVEIKIAHGEWLQPDTASSDKIYPDVIRLPGKDSQISLSGLRSNPNTKFRLKTLLDITTSEKDLDIRLIALLKNNEKIDAGWLSKKFSGGLLCYEYGFSCSMDQIEKIQVQYRWFNTVIFKNVSLIPGKKTEVKIENQPTAGKERLDLMNQARQATLACLAFAGDHGGQLPQELGQLKPYLAENNSIPLDKMELLQAGRKLSEIKDVAKMALLRMQLNDGKDGAIVAYCDGHAEYFSPERMKTKDYPKVSPEFGQTETQEQESVFGPVKEFVIYDKAESGDYLIDFDRAKLLSMPKDINWDAAKALKWAEQNGVDAGGATQPEIHGLIGYDMIVFPRENTYWEKANAELLLKEPVWELSKAGSPVSMTAQADLPQTFMFKTREGGIGVLQILSFIENPRGVKIHYKLITRKDVGHKTDVKIEIQKPIVTANSKDDTVGSQIETYLNIIRNVNLKEREQWFAAVKGLIDIGSPAVPALCEELRKTDSPRVQRLLAFTLRGIGDASTVPALIEALSRADFSSDSAFGYADTDLAKFIQKYQIDPSRNDIGLGRPVREITIALERLTGHTEGQDHFIARDEAGKPLGSYVITPEIQDRQRASYREAAKRWERWWQDKQKSQANPGGVLAAPEGSELELHIIPEPSKDSWPQLSMDDVKKYKQQLITEGSFRGSIRGDSYQWYPVVKNVLLSDNFVSEKYNDQVHVLVCARQPYSMWPDGSWKLKNVKSTQDSNGHPAILIELDDQGALFLKKLTEQNLEKRLALIIDGRIISAPMIATAISKQVIIAGNFTNQEVSDTVKALLKGMPSLGVKQKENKGPEAEKSAVDKSPTDSKFTAALPNGASVEFLGICEHPSKGKKWWRPDGTFLEQPPYNSDQVKAKVSDWFRPEYEFAFLIKNPSDPQTSFEFQIDKQGSSSNGLLNQDSQSQIGWFITSLPPKLVSTDVKVNISDTWVTFKNVSLKPGPKTDVKVEIEKSQNTTGQGTETRAEDSDWRKRFDEVYRLEDDQIVKRIAPPFIPQREIYYKTENSEQARLVHDLPAVLTFHWNGKLKNWGISFMDGQNNLAGVLENSIGIRHDELEGSEALLKTEVPGDWIIRQPSSAPEKLSALEKILKEELGKEIHFLKRTVNREVVVAQGRYHFEPLTGTYDVKQIHFYSSSLDSDQGAGGGYAETLSDLLNALADRTGVPVINETNSTEEIKMPYSHHRSSYLYDKDPATKATKLKLLLENLSKQTGLTFQMDVRSVEIWFVVEGDTVPEELLRPEQKKDPRIKASAKSELVPVQTSMLLGCGMRGDTIGAKPNDMQVAVETYFIQADEAVLKQAGIDVNRTYGSITATSDDPNYINFIRERVKKVPLEQLLKEDSRPDILDDQQVTQFLETIQTDKNTRIVEDSGPIVLKQGNSVAQMYDMTTRIASDSSEEKYQPGAMTIFYSPAAVTSESITFTARIFLSHFMDLDTKQKTTPTPLIQVADIPYQATVPNGKTFWILGPEGYFGVLSGTYGRTSDTQAMLAAKRRALFLIKPTIIIPEEQPPLPQLPEPMPGGMGGSPDTSQN